MQPHPVLDTILFNSPSLTVWAVELQLYVWASINFRLDTSKTKTLVQIREILSATGARLVEETLFDDDTILGGQVRFRTYELDRPPDQELMSA